MDFEDSKEEAGYRQQVRAWLAAHAPRYQTPKGKTLSDEQYMALAKGWQACKADAGYVGIMWPQAVGGQGGTPIQHIIFHQEEAAYRLANVPFHVGIGMCLPTLFTHGGAGVTERYVPPAIRGQELWCQLFSEPAAGSDLASVRARAIREGDEWVVNGQKIWTSYAHEADFGIVLLRTDPSQPKHKGLTMFYLDMRTPGVEVRPIKTLLGDAEFNEVFFTDVRIPDSQRLGAEGDGWKVSLTTLMFERLAVGGRPAQSPDVRALVKLAGSLIDTELENSPMVDALARFYVADEGMALTRMRSTTAVSRGQVPGPEASIGKLVMAKTLQDMSAYALELLEDGGISDREDSQAQMFKFWYLWSAGLRIAGGTDEVLRNIIAERVLGLPPEDRPDRNTPFNQLRNA
ncbi:acyl-CoA dehydrogenase [Pseudomonas poae]|uniref:Acyl-CoA dehydrogenase n=1 Tax=Pseudomonas poae TaxID=200451 RepID=A0A423ERJ4_9PSED|nr:acyl-CoA dehydrogenase family protein [Pseudomonas poae]ROM33931.1 acyl-CoA dehydrogenase [Pseudomonas poae]